jgi:MFS family permease
MKMQLPVLSGIHELSSGPRRFLFFSLFNVMSWQCIVGPAMILFARHIGMPPSRVGFLIAFMPFSMIIVLFTPPLVIRYGPKKLMFLAWISRNIIMASVFLMPLAIAWRGPEAAGQVLLAATLGFCLMRAFGVGGWFPWLHEMIPETERGNFFSTEMAIVQLINVGIIFSQGILLRGNPDIFRFLMIYAAGISAGFISLVCMSRIPGGGGMKNPDPASGTAVSYAVALRDRPFRRFVALGAACFFCTQCLGASWVLYMRDILGLSSQAIMLLMAAGSSGVLMTIRFWGRFADHSGSGRAMFKTLLAWAICALAFLALLPGAPWTPALLAVLVVLATVFGAAFWSVTHRALLNFVAEKHRAGYSSIWITGTAVTMGLTPIMAGLFIEYFGMTGFRLCFLAGGGMGLICAFLSEKIVGDSIPGTPRERILNPVTPARTLARILWITLGMHESNQPLPAKKTAR